MRTSIATRRLSTAALAGALSVCFLNVAQAQSPQPTLRLVSETPYPAAQAPAARVSEQELRDIAIDAYVYAYPMVLMELARRKATAVQSPLDGKAPMNQFGHKAAFPDPRAADTPWPSADALYSSLWFDVSREPLIVNLPDTGGRYTVLSALDMWSDVFASRGTRTNGPGAQSFAIVGPNWQGSVPAGVDVIRSPTSMGWLIGWTQAGGPQDYAAVNQIQSGMTARPLVAPVTPATANRSRAAGNPYPQTGPGVGTAPIGSAAMPTPAPATLPDGTPAEQVAGMDAATYFGVFFDALRSNPPHANDTPMLDRMRRIGLDDRQPFSYGRLSPAVQQALTDAQPLAGRRIADGVSRLGTPINGWNTVLSGIGTYGTDYSRRAAIAYAGLGAPTPEDVLYPVTVSDSKGRPLDASEDYVLHFDKGQLPPTNAFWSLHVYNGKYGFAENPANRYVLRSTDGLKFNADGSLDIYIQRRDPGEAKRANWVSTPVAEGPFLLSLRLYSPQDTALDGLWAPPPVKED
ncbi:DUF1254 domain-containing protein [Achromobacter arsenitoxydans]|uniref:DUF1254 domain-containing protein n=1 Tax=Achromobacter arsenitoxydans SY8 TaxID=477184 RepID=H0FDU0_9BURK|nr:DUF1254 domain-containing protein [Achromobacter arsenitoxydans]EHK63538.1 hypothetical protein KYC_24752 [Achromobacter arsenitoxydans SY8]